MTEIIPSILSADFAHLADEIARVEAAGVKMLHLDVMDGHFVPNITIGPPVVKSIRKATRLTLDVHLMIENPDQHIPGFLDAGANQISVHQETCPHLDRTLRFIQSHGALAGVVLNPATPVSTLDCVVDVADFVLLMTVNPGFGGQEFIPYGVRKIRDLDQRRRDQGLKLPIEIDGGVSLENLSELVRAGANWLVTGSKVFKSADPTATVVEMMRVANDAMAIRV
jgi:ribulose-phosphate 3-epimerase